MTPAEELLADRIDAALQERTFMPFDLEVLIYVSPAARETYVRISGRDDFEAFATNAMRAVRAHPQPEGKVTVADVACPRAEAKPFVGMLMTYGNRQSFALIEIDEYDEERGGGYANMLIHRLVALHGNLPVAEALRAAGRSERSS